MLVRFGLTVGEVAGSCQYLDPPVRSFLSSRLAHWNTSFHPGRVDLVVCATYHRRESTLVLESGHVVGPYRIGQLLGAGGMGEVYRARDTRLDRDVALKLLPAATLGEEAARASLVEEARTASSLNHPHICTVYEVGEAAGRAYVAMEYVEGRPLSMQVPHDGLPLEQVLRYGTQIADALAYAHERGIVHRDLKTSNVMIAPNGRAKVLDFGLARRFGENDQGEETLSKNSPGTAGEIAGTLQYMAPEILCGEQADARSDIWALGVVLYEMVAGRLPFDGKTAYELTSSILREPPRALSPRVPSGLRSVIQRCLAKEPGQRYPRSGEVRAALEAVGSSETGIAAGVPPERASPWRLSQILAASGAALAVLLLAFILLGRFVGSSHKPPKRGEALQPSSPRTSTGAPASANKEANEYFERAMLFQTGQYDPERSRELLARALELDPHFAEARGWYGTTFWQMVDGGFSNDSAMLYTAEEEAQRALQDDANCARAHYLLGWIHLYRGRKLEVKAEAERATQLNPNDVDAQNLIGNYHEFNGELELARKLEEQDLARRPTQWASRMNLGWVLSDQGEQAAAIREYEKVLDQDPQNILALVNMSHAYLLGGNPGSTRAALNRARPQDRHNFYMRISWALLLASEGKRAESRKEMDAEVLKYAALSPYAALWAAEFYAILGEKEKAVEWLDQAMRIGDERAETFARDPLLASVRDHPRFKQILDSIAFHRQQRRSPTGM